MEFFYADIRDPQLLDHGDRQLALKLAEGVRANAQMEAALGSGFTREPAYGCRPCYSTENLDHFPACHRSALALDGYHITALQPRPSPCSAMVLPGTPVLSFPGRSPTGPEID